MHPITAEQRRVAADALGRIARCQGCGEWRYHYRAGRWHQANEPCPSCGHGERREAVAA
jgi:ribosomal protein L32